MVWLSFELKPRCLQCLKLPESSCPAGGWVAGWVAGSNGNNANSASVEIEVEVEAELGKMYAE